MHVRKPLLVAAVGFALLAAGPASAVKYGDFDGDAHPQVGLMVALDAIGKPMWRCSGTMISDKVFLTAGHCTDGAARVTIWFDADVESGIPANGYPFLGQVSGTPHTHPDFPNAPFFVNDVGVVVLDAGSVAPGPYATLPQEGQLNGLAKRRGTQDVTFTAVGYGLQMSFPDPASFLENNSRVRMQATPRLLQINTPGFTGNFSMLLSNNANTGGTCFGDSGGPNFIGNSLVVGGVTSYAINGNCAGTGGVFRMDTKRALDFVQSFLD